MKAKTNLIVLICLFVAGFSFAQEKKNAVKIDSYTFGAIEARAIGPAVMSGRIMSIDAVAKNPNIIYVGAAGGGVWKSIDGGVTFKPVFDKYTQSIGDITIDQNHPDTVWVGTGESDTRNSVSVGTGIYKTTDGGDNWHLMGLEHSERIADIVIDPRNSDVIYAAVPGHLWNANKERGLYKTGDGGKTWEKILYVDENTGCPDIAIDPQEPDILYAAMWQFRRWPYFFKSGGPGSGLHKSTDGGKTWKKLTNGLPTGELGRIAVDVASSRTSVLYASVEAGDKQTAFFRSDDLGESWSKVNSSTSVTMRPFYFSHVLVDPEDYNRVYKTAYTLMVSSDAGKSFRQAGRGVHPDFHAVWINPANGRNVLAGTDGGVYVSTNRGNSFRFLRNLPVSQFYRVSCDMAKPYHVYGGLQDNGAWYGPSRSPNGIENRDWQNVGGGDGFCVYADPTDEDIVYSEWQGGNISRLYKSGNEAKDIKPHPKEGEPKYRFNWNTPVALSPNRPGKLYIGAQFLFQSTDKGESWQRISPDLTTNDPAKQKQMETGGLTIDNSSAENHCTIFTICESPLDEQIIWVGTDDGNLQVTQDGGKQWTNVVANVPGLPPATWCSSVEAGHFDKTTAYVTFDGHCTGDMKTYVYKTTDLGKTWLPIAGDAIKGYAHVIREDFADRNLLFIGAEFGLFVSVDGGEQWAQFTGKLPNVSVRDMVIHPRESDLILGTHGRGIYIIDDISPLRKITPKVLNSQVAFLPAKPTILTQPSGFMNFPGGGEFVGQNPNEVATITYYMKKRHVFGDMKIEIYNADGELVKKLPGGKRRGINRVYWQMRLKPPKVPHSPVLAGGALFGPMVPEGTYQVKLIKGKNTYTSKIQLIPDPDSPHAKADREMQQKTVWQLYKMQERLAYIGGSVTGARDQAKKRMEQLKKKDKFRKELNQFAGRLDRLHKTIVATRTGGITGEVQLREKVVGLYSSVNGYGGRPSETQLEQVPILQKEIEKKDGEFKIILKKDLPKINSRLQKKKLAPIKIMNREEWDKTQRQN